MDQIFVTKMLAIKKSGSQYTSKRTAILACWPRCNKSHPWTRLKNMTKEEYTTKKFLPQKGRILVSIAYGSPLRIHSQKPSLIPADSSVSKHHNSRRASGSMHAALLVWAARRILAVFFTCATLCMLSSPFRLFRSERTLSSLDRREASTLRLRTARSQPLAAPAKSLGHTETNARAGKEGRQVGMHQAAGPTGPNEQTRYTRGYGVLRFPHR